MMLELWQKIFMLSSVSGQKPNAPPAPKRIRCVHQSFEGRGRGHVVHMAIDAEDSGCCIEECEVYEAYDTSALRSDAEIEHASMLRLKILKQ